MSRPIAPKAAMPPSKEKKTTALCIFMPRLTRSGLMMLSTRPTTTMPQMAKKRAR